MGKLSVFENISQDGYFAGPNGEIDWFVAHHGNQEEDEYAVDSVKSTGTLLFGRVTYELMVGYWPTDAAKKNSPRLAERMNNIPKIVFSRTLDNVELNNTMLIKENIEQEIEMMKDKTVKDMTILGSGSIVSAFAQRGLIDEYEFMVNPVVLGSGRSIFQGIRNRIPLKMLKTRTFKSGNFLLQYQPAKQ